nr:type VI secretion system baseplate subunit TssK [Gammaproteobacteria bacterium]
MDYFNRVTWCEGMLLEPQHFQQQERYLQYQQHKKLKMIDPYQYGIISIEADTHLLEQGSYSLIQCSAIFPDGTYYDAPNHDSLPDCIELHDCSKNSKISLSLPYLQPEIENLRHIQQSYNCKDTLTNRPSHTDLQVSKLKPKLIIDKNNKCC